MKDKIRERENKWKTGRTRRQTVLRKERRMKGWRKSETIIERAKREKRIR